MDGNETYKEAVKRSILRHIELNHFLNEGRRYEMCEQDEFDIPESYLKSDTDLRKAANRGFRMSLRDNLMGALLGIAYYGSGILDANPSFNAALEHGKKIGYIDDSHVETSETFYKSLIDSKFQFETLPDQSEVQLDKIVLQFPKIYNHCSKGVPWKAFGEDKLEKYCQKSGFDDFGITIEDIRGALKQQQDQNKERLDIIFGNK